ncbi:MAG: hypothetical protein JSS07_05130 [Proteobacteria bacterium]|nr:hypothetical protein [Pseudomonadota bacterium]
MQKLKESIFGSAFIIALGIIFIPMWMQKSEPSKENEQSLKQFSWNKKAVMANPETLSNVWDIKLDVKNEDPLVLLVKLKQQGIPAYVRDSMTNKDQAVVYVGPIVRNEDALKLNAAIASKYNVNGTIVHHTILRKRS